MFIETLDAERCSSVTFSLILVTAWLNIRMEQGLSIIIIIVNIITTMALQFVGCYIGASVVLGSVNMWDMLL